MALPEIKTMQESVLDSIPQDAMDTFVVIDSANTVMEWNCQAQRLLGWTNEEALGKPLDDLIIPAASTSENNGARWEHHSVAELRQSNRQVQLAVLHKDGGEVDIELSAAPV
ncbi:PAS domain S-box protein, partial [Halorubrum sp. Atlit-28R]|uniref:PAS domain S-box protein n=1 Tax=Halorubrum sp. Atlit-28R TaxID=2282129 RepID=UPI000EF1AA1F